eukprot:CAMPEP_0171737202 /NCGR_PEP_ID=MMETSP0991-20121206/32777_1 /TAXON_ID=483369 /ORGANISM="non described non described, Strain CCMP2098" /LENGTH=91 /DNA_ID=CAMNT_0012334143 /DNA_START=656 /DNA_END=928 /DNA_ORIENTATION=-
MRAGRPGAESAVASSTKEKPVGSSGSAAAAGTECGEDDGEVKGQDDETDKEGGKVLSLSESLETGVAESCDCPFFVASSSSLGFLKVGSST